MKNSKQFLKLKKNNIVLICLAVVFFTNTAANFIIAQKKVKEKIEMEKHISECTPI